MNCRPGCAACCIVLSISSPLPGMPQGKPAGTVCNHLDRQSLQCTIWGQDNYPDVCRQFSAKLENCGTSTAEAIQLLTQWEEKTKPSSKA